MRIQIKYFGFLSTLYIMMKQIFYHGFLAGRFCRYKRFMADTENWCYVDARTGTRGV